MQARETSELRITEIWVDDANCDKDGKNMALSVELNNGSNFIIYLDSRAHEPLFDDVLKGKCGKPDTDGKKVYWPNGASLSIPEMLLILQTANNGA